MTVISNMIDVPMVEKRFMEFEIYCGKHILRNFTFYSEICLINKLPNKLQVKYKL